jgi:hypothetical protein
LRQHLGGAEAQGAQMGATARNCEERGGLGLGVHQDGAAAVGRKEALVAPAEASPCQALTSPARGGRAREERLGGVGSRLSQGDPLGGAPKLRDREGGLPPLAQGLEV